MENEAGRKELGELILDSSLSSSWSESVVGFSGSNLLLVVNISFEIF